MAHTHGVILDVDDTLVDSNDAHAKSWVEALAEHDYTVPFEKVRRLIGEGGDKVLPETIGIQDESDEGKQISSRRGEIFKERYLPSVRAFPSAQKLLDHMRTRSLKLAVASSAKPDELRALLQIVGAADLIEEKSSSKDAKNSKPDPEIMHVTMEKIDLLKLSVSGAPVRNNKGELIGALCICRDVTERSQLEKRTQATLGALLEMAEALVLIGENPSGKSGELIPTGIGRTARRMAQLTYSVLGCQRVILSAIEPDTEVLHSIAVVGLSPEEERQWWNEQQTEARLGDGLEPPFTAQLRANEALLLDITKPPFSEQPNPYNIHTMLIVPMVIGEQLVGLLSLDYGGQKHDYDADEIALAKAVAKLAALVIERDRLLRERAEARANELALREANRRMDEFLGMTSHELKTPLTSIKGNTQLTVRQIKNSLLTFQKMQGMLESTERQIKLLDRLVDDLLDVSRSEEQNLELSLMPCNLASMMHEAVEEQRLAWPNRTITLEMSDEIVAPILADADRIGQVLRNYISNALKYSPEDRPIQVSVHINEENARVSVRDEGSGLSLEEQTQIWERFYRVHGTRVSSSTGSSNAGLGLGLYICKAIIEQLQGNVGVESTPGEGSTFWFSLPLTSSIEQPYSKIA